LATTVTLSDERSWRYYAGLSDFPHYDAYRVIAPAADAWSNYDRWGGERIRWGAPLETIGDMTRSLRELNRPRPIAYWSQGAHAGWGGRWSPRRGSPTPDELRSQAWHGLANRLTSLYWFNLSLESLVKFRDLIEPITRVNREIEMLALMMLEGDAFEYSRVSEEGTPQWDLNSIATSDSLLMVVHDLAYRADPKRHEFVFTPRQGTFAFRLPSWLAATETQSADVFRLDADGSHDVTHEWKEGKLVSQDQIDGVGVYVLAIEPGKRTNLDDQAAHLREWETQTGFDPANRDSDFEELRALLSKP
jgi:hypothetical protein